MSNSKPKDTKPVAATRPRIQGAMTKEQVHNLYNPAIIIPNKIRGGLKELGEAACTPNDFARLCGISSMQLAMYENLFEEFTAIVVDNGRRKTLWCGTPKLAAEIRNDIGR